MILKRNINRLFLFTGLLISQVAVFGQEAAANSSVEVDRPIYEDLGVSPTVLAIIMVSITAILLGFVISLSSSTKNIIEFKNKRLNGGSKVLLLLMGLGITSTSFAAEPQGDANIITFSDTAFWTFIIVDIVLVLIIVYLSRLMKGIISEYTSTTEFRLFKRMKKNLTDAVPIEDEKTILLDHDYDGIRELDNNLPPWWKYGFYVTIVWAVVYLFYYQILEIGPLQEAEYQLEMEEGDREVAEYKAEHPELITVDNVELLTDGASINKGRDIFNMSCVSCHMEGGKGGIGPNLTDEYWLYGNDIKGVFKTISEGAQNGMVAWKDLMPANDIQAVASYILQLDYIAPPNGKEPQGTISE